MQKKIYNANKYGAVPDGKTLCTSAIQSAIDEAAANGGGIITFDKGNYLTGTVFIKSNIDFEISEGVALLGVVDEASYPEFWNRVAGVEMLWPVGVLTVMSQHNVRIFGGGTIDGQGEYWWHKYWGGDRRGGMRKIYDAQGLRSVVDYDCKRPRNIVVINSTDIEIENLLIKRSGFWNVHICYSYNVKIADLKITENYGPSTDGIDIDSSCNVTVESCHIECSDDNICIKSGRDADGLRVGRPCENIVVRNCIIGKGDGVTVGSETSGGMRNIEFSGIKMSGTKNGIRLKSAKTRGGIIENIRFSDFDITDVPIIFNFQLNWNPEYSYCKIPETWQGEIPAHWQTLCRQVLPPERGIPEFKNIAISNIRAHCISEKCSSTLFKVEGSPQKPIKSVSFKNIVAEASTAGFIKYACGWSFDNAVFNIGDETKINLEQCCDIKLDSVRYGRP